jgi:hypothetical protein
MKRNGGRPETMTSVNLDLKPGRYACRRDPHVSAGFGDLERGLVHRPGADAACHVPPIEPKGEPNSGDGGKRAAAKERI